MRPVDRESLLQALLAFLGFLFAILVEAYVKEPASGLGNTHLVFLLGAIVVSAFVYFFSASAPRKADRQSVTDLLTVCGIALGAGFRLNIMRLDKAGDEGDAIFEFVAQYNMHEPHRYDGRVKLSSAGAGSAYLTKKLVYLSNNELDRSIDNYPLHLWSCPVTGRRGGRCILNVDTNSPTISPERGEEIGDMVEALAKILARYSPGRFPNIK